MIGEHEAWLANNDSKGTAKAKKAVVHKKDNTRDSTKVMCWCCGDNGHYRDRCPKREKAFCRKCKNKWHYDRACRSKAGT